MEGDRNPYYWANDPYFTDALDRYILEQDKGRKTIVLDLEAIQVVLSDGGSEAYRLIEALASVEREEGYDGRRGAPRVLLAILQRLSEIKGAESINVS